MKKICGLWIRETKDGRKYFGGDVLGFPILVFKNDHRKSDRDPEYWLYIAEPRQQGSQHNGDAPPQQDADEIPF